MTHYYITRIRPDGATNTVVSGDLLHDNRSPRELLEGAIERRAVVRPGRYVVARPLEGDLRAQVFDVAPPDSPALVVRDPNPNAEPTS